VASVAVVGTRQPTPRGIGQVRQLAARLAANGVPVISGLATGIDTAALTAGGRAVAVIVPLAELRRLRAVERHASPEALEEAEIEATLAAHDEWVAAGCPGARPHEDVMAELLGGDQ
jgi:predicted Rossmann fold nucleotide-binding protein DprA/Smf involved in DNA uptake